MPFEEPVEEDLFKYRVNWQKAIFVFDEMDTLTMRLDIDQKSLSFSLNGDPFKEMFKIEPSSYYLAVVLPEKGTSMKVEDYRFIGREVGDEKESNLVEDVQTQLSFYQV